MQTIKVIQRLRRDQLTATIFIFTYLQSEFLVLETHGFHNYR